MQLTPVAPPPAGLLLVLKPLKPIAAKGPVPASYGRRLRRTNLSWPLPAPSSNVRRMGHYSCPAARTKARDEAEADQVQAPAKEGEEAAVERNRGERSMAYQLFEAVYVCAYVCCWRLGELIAVNTQEAMDKLRGYFLDNFNQKC